MSRPLQDYASAKHRHLNRVVDYLSDRHRLEPYRQGAFPLVDIRKLLHYSGADVFLEPIIGELEAAGAITIVSRGVHGMVYLTPTWETFCADLKAKGEKPKPF